MNLKAKQEYEAGLAAQLEQINGTLKVLTCAVESQPLVKGSRGQPVVNPAARELASLHKSRADLAKQLVRARASFGVQGL